MRRVKHIILFIIFSLIAFGGNVTERPRSQPIAVGENRWYVGLDTGYMRLKDSYSKEVFSTVPLGLIAGYRFHPNLALELRYWRDTGKVRYDGGNTINPDVSDFPTVFSAGGIYLRPSLHRGMWEFYALAGYGFVKLTDIKGADRIERSFQYGGGVAYHLSDRWELFVDGISLYHDKGFDGRARLRTVHSEVVSIGVRYAF